MNYATIRLYDRKTQNRYCEFQVDTALFFESDSITSNYQGRMHISHDKNYCDVF